MRCSGTLDPYWRITISLNDEPQNLCVLPPMDESVEDKIILLKTERPGLFNEPEWANAGRRANEAKLRAELPGFLHHLESFQIPEGLRSSRFGIRHFQHQDLLSALGALSNEQRLLDLIDIAIFPPLGKEPLARHPVWQGDAASLEHELRQTSSERQVGILLSWAGACGTYLAELARTSPERVTVSGKNSRDKKKTFRIEPPTSAAAS